MKQLIEALLRDKDIARARELLFADSNEILISGVSGGAKHLTIAAACARSLVIICRNRASVEEWQSDLAEILPKAQIMILPETEIPVGNGFSGAVRGRELAAERLEVLSRMRQKENGIIVLATARAAAAKDIPPSALLSGSIKIALGDTYPLQNLVRDLTQIGYERTTEVERMGEFCVRGGIVDIFPINASMPVRAEFFGDEVDSVRRFDLEDRRSTINLSGVKVVPFRAPDAVESGNIQGSVPFVEYFDNGAVIFDEPIYIREELSAITKEMPEVKPFAATWENLIDAARKNSVAYMTLLPQKIPGAKLTANIGIAMTGGHSYNRQTDLLTAQIGQCLKEKKTVVILSGSLDKANGIREFLVRQDVPAVVAEGDDNFSARAVNVLPGTLTSGFDNPAAKLYVITAREIYGTAKKRRLTVNRERPYKTVDDIVPGDYVVHEAHGIGRYVGVETILVDGVHKDYLHIRYGGNDKLFVPVDQVHLLQKYIGNEGEVPRLNSMGGNEWNRARTKAKAAAEDIAGKLLEIYAARNSAEGFAFSPDDAGMREFEDAFPYEETPDQLRAIADVKHDMESRKPMDRLVCGDVGFGKTEVAIRAAYKAAADGKQTAVLVPTTVLAEQHFHTFTSRFHNFAVSVGVVCRFRSLKEQRETLQKVAEGKIDVLIGTHAILNTKRIQFKDLGLLIIDEEQRFGVKQKEKIRSRATGADILSLSATPIPRTLHMSLAGVRDMSLISTPIVNRLPVQTYVAPDDDRFLAGAIKRELKRGGQVYFVYNRVETIETMLKRLTMLVPEARIMAAHGQMPEGHLEQIMMDFFDGNVDVLLATSIVENGLDAQNANTIIIYDADKFGLSQLYQMRGRVGRSGTLAFAYFVYRADKIISETAEKRLQTMREFAELGAGFKIAMKDLAIRGAGNLLGSQQHGHIAGVGFNLYCKMLEDATRMYKLKQCQKEGTAPPPQLLEPAEEPLIAIQTEAYIDGGYIADAGHKLEIYRRIADIRNDKEIDELTDELIDRFGEPSECVTALLNIARLKNAARDLGVKSIVENGNYLNISFLEKNKLNLQRMADIPKTFGKNVIMQPERHMMKFKIREQRKTGNFAARLLNYMAGK